MNIILRKTLLKSEVGKSKVAVEKFGYLEKAFERAFQFDDIHAAGHLTIQKPLDR